MNNHAIADAHSHDHAALPPSSDMHHYDIVVIGAGISGINAGYRIQTTLPNYTYTILEGRADLGGTWNLFKYPGVRSDSDLHTYGFPFNPWDKPNTIATGASIYNYMKETAYKFGIDKHIQYKHHVATADWASETQNWRLEVEADDGTTYTTRKIFHAKFIFLATGYYNYENPLEAVIPGLEKFEGAKVHPQFWPEDLDYKGKRMVVIGSGATAITILPAVVETGIGHVIMLQRSPSYVMNMPQKKPGEKKWYDYLPSWIAPQVLRLQFLVIPWLFYNFCRAFPAAAANFLQREAKLQLPKDFPIDPHFKPTYNPWDQRLCLCPDSDFFKCFHTGKAEIVTSKIKEVVSDGIILDAGEKLDADIIVTATGLNLQFCGNIALSVDKEPVSLPDCYLWRASMLSGVPNLGLITGYVNYSWTLGADSTSRLLTRLVKFIEDNKYTSATPRITPAEAKNPQSPLNLESTYVTSRSGSLPHAGSTGPWQPRSNYFKDNWNASKADITQGLEFKRIST